MSSPSSQPLPEDDYIDTHNTALQEYSCMKKYRDDSDNGLLGTALGPPLSRLKGVPQSRYMGNSKNADTIFGLKPPIRFFVSKTLGSEHLELKGLKLVDAIEGNTNELRQATERMWLSDSTKTHIRLRVDGYPDHGEPMASRRANVEQDLLELTEIAKKVAIIIKNSMPLVKHGSDEVHQWHLPDGDKINFKGLILLELRHVSTGSWQPVLAYADPDFR